MGFIWLCLKKRERERQNLILNVMESKPPAANEPEKKVHVEITKAVKMQSQASLPDDMA